MSIIIPPTPVNDEPVNEFTEMQSHLDRAGWIGTGCTRPFEHDALSGGAEGAGKGTGGK